MAIASVKVIIDGQTQTLTYNSSTNKYEATITAPGETSWYETNNKYGVTVTATDTAGNTATKDRTDSVLGDVLQLRVLETTKPTVNITAPSSGARLITATPKVKFTLRDADSGIKISTLQLKIDSGTTITNTSDGMSCTSVTGGYDCEYIPPTSLSEGTHNITVQIEDNDGNTSALASSSFIVDTIPPALNITNPSEGFITNKASLLVEGTTNDETSSPVTITITLNGVDQGSVGITSGGFSKSITLTEGQNVIVVKVEDTAGLTSTVTRNVTLDTSPPVITAVTLVPNPVDCGKTVTVTVTVTDD